MERKAVCAQLNSVAVFSKKLVVRKQYAERSSPTLCFVFPD